MKKQYFYGKCKDCGAGTPRKEAVRCMTCNGAFKTVPMEKRFWKYVNKTTHCWIWTGALGSGYGLFYAGKRIGRRKASQISWIIHNGPIPKGKWVLHNCSPLPDNRACVRPDHLWLGNAKDNSIDMFNKGFKSPIGEKQGRAKLSDEIVRKIRKIHNIKARGFRTCDLAREYGVSHGAIDHAIKRITWKHVS